MSEALDKLEYMDCIVCRQGEIPVHLTNKGHFSDKSVCNLCNAKPGGEPSNNTSFMDTLFSLFK